MKAVGSTWLQEPSDELQGIDGEGAGASTGVFLIGEAHLPVVDLEDALIGDGDLEHVRGQIVDRGLGAGYGLGVDVPVLRPECVGQLVEQTGLSHLIAELRAEQPRERLDGQKEAVA